MNKLNFIGNRDLDTLGETISTEQLRHIITSMKLQYEDEAIEAGFEIEYAKHYADFKFWLDLYLDGRGYDNCTRIESSQNGTILIRVVPEFIQFVAVLNEKFEIVEFYSVHADTNMDGSIYNEDPRDSHRKTSSFPSDVTEGIKKAVRNIGYLGEL